MKQDILDYFSLPRRYMRKIASEKIFLANLIFKKNFPERKPRKNPKIEVHCIQVF